MRFLADESVDIAIVRVLRQDSHDVASIAETQAGASDEDVIQRARSEARILLTEDRDFGRLIYAELQTSGTVIYVRYPSFLRQEFALEVSRFVVDQGDSLHGSFVVLQPGRARIGRLPDA